MICSWVIVSKFWEKNEYFLFYFGFFWCFKILVLNLCVRWRTFSERPAFDPVDYGWRRCDQAIKQLRLKILWFDFCWFKRIRFVFDMDRVYSKRIPRIILISMVMMGDGCACQITMRSMCHRCYSNFLWKLWSLNFDLWIFTLWLSSGGIQFRFSHFGVTKQKNTHEYVADEINIWIWNEIPFNWLIIQWKFRTISSL